MYSLASDMSSSDLIYYEATLELINLDMFHV